jgi:hypothetical protein
MIVHKPLHTLKASPKHGSEEYLPDTALCLTRDAGGFTEKTISKIKEEDPEADLYERLGDYYDKEAKEVVNFLLANMPQGLTDRITGHLLLKKASNFIICQDIRSLTEAHA